MLIQRDQTKPVALAEQTLYGPGNSTTTTDGLLPPRLQRQDPRAVPPTRSPRTDVDARDVRGTCQPVAAASSPERRRISRPTSGLSLPTLPHSRLTSPFTWYTLDLAVDVVNAISRTHAGGALCRKRIS